MCKIGHERVPLTQISPRNKIIKESKPHHTQLSFSVQTQRADCPFVILTQRPNQLIVLVYQQRQLHPPFIWIFYFLPCWCQKKNSTMKLNPLLPTNFHMNICNNHKAWIACEKMSLLATKDLTMPLQQKDAFKICHSGKVFYLKLITFLTGSLPVGTCGEGKNCSRD